MYIHISRASQLYYSTNCVVRFDNKEILIITLKTFIICYSGKTRKISIVMVKWLSSFLLFANNNNNFLNSHKVFSFMLLCEFIAS